MHIGYGVTYYVTLPYKDMGNGLGNYIGILTYLVLMSVPEGETTVLTAATTTSKSLRTTIPAGIVRQFALSDGDKLQWKIEAKNNELVIVARPLKKKSSR